MYLRKKSFLFNYVFYLPNLNDNLKNVQRRGILWRDAAQSLGAFKCKSVLQYIKKNISVTIASSAIIEISLS